MTWDEEADVVVLGSGGAALTAAIAAHDFGAREVLILEKSNMIGGTTAMSGGMLWIPINQHQAEAGHKDSWDDVVTYLDSLAPGELDPVTLEGFLVGGKEMVRHLAEHTPVRLRTFDGFPDYHPDAPGGRAEGGRSLDNDPFPFVELGNWASRVVPPKSGAPRLTSLYEDFHTGPLPEDVLEERRRTDTRGSGQALVGALLRAVLDREIAFRFEHRALKLHKEDNRITGVAAETPGGTKNVLARKGVILATGGFEWNKELVQTFLRGPMTGPATVPESEGDGLLMAIEAGAKLGNMSNTFWMPTALEWQQQHRNAKPNYLLCLSERTLPGSILVNRSGARFTNEAASYNALGLALHAFDANSFDHPNLPFYLIFDHRFRSRYPAFGHTPEQPLSDMFAAADTLPELAEKLGIDSDGLVGTVERFNGFVDEGRDDDFQRGANTYDNFWGDRNFDAPYRTLGKLDQPPYYAVKLEAGTLGTNGGAKTNADGQVVNWQGNPIPGLYAAGNVMAAPLTKIYGGAGGTLGPALTFGYLAGKHAAKS